MRFLGFFKFIISVMFFGTLMYGGYFIFEQYIWNALNPEPSMEERFVKEVDKISNIEHFSENVKLDNREPFALLLLGVDGDSFNATRSDSIMLGIIDPQNSSISLLSIPRDLRVELAGNNGHDKINAAFAKGGVDMTAKTLEDLFDIPIDYYATINFKGFQEMVDALGGIEIDVEKDLTFSDRITKTRFSLNKGFQKLNGIEALNYARFRGDGEGDFGRMRRQQQVIRAIVDQSISFRNIPKIVDIIEVVDDNFESNVSYKDLGLLAIKMRSIQGNGINSISFESSPDMIGGVSYVIADEGSIDKTSIALKQLLND
jgi:polyisoprenyl-teichoic acid--peptidoglycan teichoic acid transferase